MHTFLYPCDLFSISQSANNLYSTVGVSVFFLSSVFNLHSLLTCEVSGGIGEGDLDWKASWEMKPESWEETEERRAGVCWGSTEDEEEEAR